MNMFDLSGKVALVTGRRSGIGQGIAIGLAEAGADIIALDMGEVSETKKRVEELGRKCWEIQCALGENGKEKEVIGKAVEMAGKIDILVNCAGMIKRQPILEYEEAAWDSVISLNLRSVFFMCQEAAKQMVKQGGGKIINIASLLAYQGGVFVPSYTASKHGVKGITMALSNELASVHVNVNAIAPGYIRTNVTDALQKDEERSRSILDRIPAGKWGVPEDIKGTAVFLASAASDYVNGITIPVDGGWMGR